MIETLETYCARPNQRFVCYGAGGKKSQTYTAHVKHMLHAPADPGDLRHLQFELGDLAEQFLAFYSRHDGALLFADTLSDTAGFRLGHVADWERLTREMMGWWDMLVQEGREDENMDWLETAIAFGEVPHSGNYFAIAREGTRRGSIIYSRHDGLECDTYAKDLFSFL